MTLKYDDLCDKAQEMFNKNLNNHSEEMMSYIEHCESPIEQVLAMRFFEYLQSHHPHMLEFRDNLDLVEIRSQETIEANNNTYRADFVIPVWDRTANSGIVFVIECDGHDYHEKTIEQAQRDKKRDRDMAMEDYVVLRYTGSEIYSNPEIAREIMGIVRHILLKRRELWQGGQHHT